ncbi:hypothetical protein GCM10010112_15420 [Actinoplanes lobatus]|nr:hypothetical protein GCM10010112_15420 [Actinoplanes lobatus]
MTMAVVRGGAWKIGAALATSMFHKGRRTGFLAHRVFRLVGFAGVSAHESRRVGDRHGGRAG